MTAVEPISTGPLTRREILIVFVGLMTALFLSALDTNIVGVALPTIVGDLGGLQQIAWVGTAYLLTSTAATPAVREVLRPLRPSPPVPGRDHGLRRRLAAVRDQPDHDAARAVTWGAGRRGWRDLRHGVRGDRRRGAGTGARPLRGVLHVGVRVRQRGRPAPRRVLRRQHRLALDLPHQRAPRGDRDGRDLGRPAAPLPAAAPQDRRARRHAPRRRRRVVHPHDLLGRRGDLWRGARHPSSGWAWPPCC